MKKQTKYRLALVLALALLVVTVVIATANASDILRTTATYVPDDVAPEITRSNTGVPGLEPALSNLYLAYTSNDLSALQTFAGLEHVDLQDQVVRVILEMSIDPQPKPGLPTYETVILEDGSSVTIEHAPQVTIRQDLLTEITDAGATYETAYKNLVQVLAPFNSLEQLTLIDGVDYVRLPLPAQNHDLPNASITAGAVESEGVIVTNADNWHDAGFDGTGIKLAVYDFGFTGWAARSSAGDLPSGGQLVQKDFSTSYSFSPDTSGNEHGTACAEITYDMAPGSTIYLYAWGTDVEFGQAVADYMAIDGNRVAAMSVGWNNAGPYDGTGSINDIIDDALADGIFWANSAGNSQKQHWSGTSVQYGSTGDQIAFGTGNAQGIGPEPTYYWEIAARTNLYFFLEWNDWNALRTGNQDHIDYDLYLYENSGSGWTMVASSEGDQCGDTVEPVEAIAYSVPNPGPRYYALTIQRYEGGGTCPNNFGHWMDLYTWLNFGDENAFCYSNPCNSLTIPADGDSAVTVGAAFWNDDGNATYDYGLEPFSSLGPRNATGGANPGTTVNKPDMVAPDGVSTASYGASNSVRYAEGGDGFFGTSAAAPHVGGMAAAAWESSPTMTASQLRTFLQDYSATKGGGGACGGGTMGNSGGGEITSLVQNNRFGWGRAELPVGPTNVSLIFLDVATPTPWLLMIGVIALVALTGVVFQIARRGAIRQE